MEKNWTIIAEQFDKFLRLETFPLAFKLFEKIEEAEKISKVRKLDFKPRLGQVITLARRYGWTLLITREIIGFDYCASIIGLCPIPEQARDGLPLKGVWYKTIEDSRKHQEGLPRIPTGKYTAAVLAPLKANKFDPDLIVIYCNPAQVVRILTALQWEDYQRQTFYYSGESSCADLFGGSLNENKVVVTLPCFGERRFGYVQDDEMAVGIPVGYLEKILEGMEITEKNGLRYPIPYFGAQLNVDAGMPKEYKTTSNQK